MRQLIAHRLVLCMCLAGVYNYQCTPHLFTGTFTVTCPNGISDASNGYFSFSFPNPFSNKLTIGSSEGDAIALYNFIGEKIKIIAFIKGQTITEINSADMTSGIYFYTVLKEGIIIETKKVLKN